MTEYQKHYTHLLDMVDNFQGDRTDADSGAKLFDEVYDYFHANLPKQTEYDAEELYNMCKKDHPDLKTACSTIQPYTFMVALLKRILTVCKISVNPDTTTFNDFTRTYGPGIFAYSKHYPK